MPLLIDGYNLLNVTGITGRGNDLTALHRSRPRLTAIPRRFDWARRTCPDDHCFRRRRCSARIAANVRA